MLAENEIELTIQRLAAMDKPALVATLRAEADRFPSDLTDDYLASLGEEKLRHLVAALCLHCGVVPAEAGTRDARGQAA